MDDKELALLRLKAKSLAEPEKDAIYPTVSPIDALIGLSPKAMAGLASSLRTFMNQPGPNEILQKHGEAGEALLDQMKKRGTSEYDPEAFSNAYELRKELARIMSKQGLNKNATPLKNESSRYPPDEENNR